MKLEDVPPLNIEGMTKLNSSLTNVINRNYLELGLSPIEVISVLSTLAISVCANSSDPIRHLSVMIRTLDSQQTLDTIKKLQYQKVTK